MKKKSAKPKLQAVSEVPKRKGKDFLPGSALEFVEFEVCTNNDPKAGMSGSVFYINRRAIQTVCPEDKETNLFSIKLTEYGLVPERSSSRVFFGMFV